MPVRRVTVLSTVLVALCAYGLFAPPEIPARRLSVRGTQHALPGEPVLLRALVHDEHDRPVPGVAVAVSELASGKTAASATTGTYGEARVELAGSEAATTDYEAHAPGVPPVRFQVVRRVRHDITVTSDRAEYRPGEPVLITVLVRGLLNLVPVAGAQVEFDLYDAHKRAHGRETVTTDPFGLAHIKATAPADQGAWVASVTIGGQRADLPFRVAQRETPPLDLTARVETPAVRWGDTVPVAVRAFSRSGEPATGGIVRVTVRTGVGVVVTREAVLDDAGEARVMLPLPAGAPAGIGESTSERRDLDVEVQATDPLGQKANAQSVLRVQAGPLLLRAEPQGVWQPGAPNRVRVWAEGPDGAVRPARLTVRVQGGALLKPLSQDGGAAEFALPAFDGQLHLAVLAVDDRHAAARRFSFASSMPGRLTVRAAATAIGARDGLALVCVAPEAGTLRVDVYAHGRLIAMADRAHPAGVSPLTVALPPGPPCLLSVHAYPAGHGREVPPFTVPRGEHARLDVSVEAEKPAYRPGEAAALKVQVSGGSDPAAATVVSLAVHDRATAGETGAEAPADVAVPVLDAEGLLEDDRDWFALVTRWLPRSHNYRASNELAVTLLFWWLLLVAVPVRMFRKARLDAKRDQVDADGALVRLRLTLAVWMTGALFLTLFVTSQFKSIFNSMNVELPAATKFLLATGDFLADFGIAVPVAYVVADRLLIWFHRWVGAKSNGRIVLSVAHSAALPAMLGALGVSGLALFMPMLKLINNVDGGYESPSPSAPAAAPLGVATQAPARRNFPTTLILEPALRLDATRAARVTLPPSDAVTVYDAHVDAYDAHGLRGAGTGAVRYTLPLYGRLRAPERLRAGDRTTAKALIYSTSDTEADVVLATPWGEQRARVKLSRGRGAAVTFALAPVEAGTATLTLTVSAGSARDVSETKLDVRDAAAGVTRLVRGVAPPQGPWHLPAPAGFQPGTMRARLTLSNALEGFPVLLEHRPAYSLTGDEATEALARLDAPQSSGDPSYAGARAAAFARSATARLGDGTWLAALDLIAARRLDPDIALPCDPFPSDGLVGGGAIEQPDLRPTAFAATLAREAGLETPGLAAAHAMLAETAPGALEGPYRAALTANWLLAQDPRNPLLPVLLDRLEATRRPVDPPWLPECATLSGPREAAIETAALALRALASSGRTGLLMPLRWLMQQKPEHAIARLARVRAAVAARHENSGGDVTVRGQQKRSYNAYTSAVAYDGALGADGLTLDFDRLDGWVYELEVTGAPAGEVESAGNLRARFRWASATVAPGGVIEGLITVKNDSAYDSGPLQIAVPLPAGLALLQDSGENWTQRDDAAVQTLDALAAGRTLQLRLRARPLMLGAFGAPAARVTDALSGAQLTAPPQSGPTVTVAPPADEL